MKEKSKLKKCWGQERLDSWISGYIFLFIFGIGDN